MREIVIVLPTIVRLVSAEYKVKRLQWFAREFSFEHSAVGGAILEESINTCFGCADYPLTRLGFTAELDATGIVGIELTKKRLRCTTITMKRSVTQCENILFKPRLFSMAFNPR